MVVDKNGVEIKSGQTVVVYSDKGTREAVVIKPYPGAPTVNAPGHWVDVTINNEGAEGMPSYLLEVSDLLARTSGVVESESTMNEHDWLQIEQAASGCISGTSDDWPDLRNAIEKLTGKSFGLRKSADWMRGYCEAVMWQRDAVMQ